MLVAVVIEQLDLDELDELLVVGGEPLRCLVLCRFEAANLAPFLGRVPEATHFIYGYMASDIW